MLGREIGRSWKKNRRNKIGSHDETCLLQFQCLLMKVMVTVFINQRWKKPTKGKFSALSVLSFRWEHPGNYSGAGIFTWTDVMTWMKLLPLISAQLSQLCPIRRGECLQTTCECPSTFPEVGFHS